MSPRRSCGTLKQRAAVLCLLSAQILWLLFGRFENGKHSAHSPVAVAASGAQSAHLPMAVAASAAPRDRAMDIVFRGNVVCCQPAPHASHSKRLCRFSTAVRAQVRAGKKGCLDPATCATCGIVFGPGHAQYFNNILAGRLFGLRTPAMTRRNVSGDGVREVGFWDAALHRDSKSQAARALTGLTQRRLEAEMKCLDTPACKARYPVSGDAWNAIMSFDFLLQNDDRFDTLRCGIAHRTYRGRNAWEENKVRTCGGNDLQDSGRVLHVFLDKAGAPFILDHDFRPYRHYDQLNWSIIRSLRSVPEDSLDRVLALPRDAFPEWATSMRGMEAQHYRPDILAQRVEILRYFVDFIRRLRSGASPTSILAFSAIPKVGGTSFEAMANDGQRGVYSYTHGAKAWRSCHDGRDCRFLCGHATLKAMRAKVRPVEPLTFMLFREPIARSLSSYFYYYEGKFKGKYAPVDLAGYALQPRWCNLQTRYLANDLSPIQNEADGVKRLRAAIRSLRQVDVIGVQEHFAESLGMLGAVWTPVLNSTAPERRNANKHPAKLSAADRHALERCDGLDIELYKHVKLRFVAQRAACRIFGTGACGHSVRTPWEPVGPVAAVDNVVELHCNAHDAAGVLSLRNTSKGDIGVFTLPRHLSSCMTKFLGKRGVLAAHEKLTPTHALHFDYRYSLGMRPRARTMVHAVLHPLVFIPWCMRQPPTLSFRKWAGVGVDDEMSVASCARMWIKGHTQIISLKPDCIFQTSAVPARMLCMLLRGHQCSDVPVQFNATQQCNSSVAPFSWADVHDVGLVSELKLLYYTRFGFD